MGRDRKKAKNRAKLKKLNEDKIPDVNAATADTGAVSEQVSALYSCSRVAARTAQVVRRVKYHQIVSHVLRADTMSSRIPAGVLVDTLRGRARIFSRYVCVSCIRLVSHTRAHTTHILHSPRPIRTAATRHSRTRRPRRSRRNRLYRPLPLRLAPTTTAVAAAAAALHTPRAHTYTHSCCAFINP